MKENLLVKLREFGRNIRLYLLSQEITLKVPAIQEGLKCINRSLRKSLQRPQEGRDSSGVMGGRPAKVVNSLVTGTIPKWQMG
jgi:hypothetical protein